MKITGNLTEEQYDRLNPPYDVEFEDSDYDDTKWIHLGFAPMPRNRWQWFVYHVCNGLLMRYPLHKVIVWSLLNTKPDREQVWADGIEEEVFTELVEDFD